MGLTRPLFVYLRHFLNITANIFDYKSIEGMLGIRKESEKFVWFLHSFMWMDVLRCDDRERCESVRECQIER